MNKGCLILVILGIVISLIGKYAPVDLKGSYCSKKTTVKYTLFKGEGWFYKCIDLNSDSTCTITIAQSNGSNYQLTGKWSDLSNGVCRISGVSEEKDNYNGIYEFKDGDLFGREPVWGVYTKDYTP
jgi:hypothetical protein